MPGTVQPPLEISIQLEEYIRFRTSEKPLPSSIPRGTKFQALSSRIYATILRNTLHPRKELGSFLGLEFSSLLLPQIRSPLQEKMEVPLCGCTSPTPKQRVLLPLRVSQDITEASFQPDLLTQKLFRSVSLLWLLQSRTRVLLIFSKMICCVETVIFLKSNVAQRMIVEA